jgi:hypothetical protein
VIAAATAPTVDERRRRAKTLAILREGRCTILRAVSDETNTVTRSLARVQGHRGAYAVDLVHGAWECTCGRDGCAHVEAVKLVTGHGGDA